MVRMLLHFTTAGQRLTNGYAYFFSCRLKHDVSVNQLPDADHLVVLLGTVY